MYSHYHLIIETLDRNLAKATRQLNEAYKHTVHLFQEGIR